MSRFVAGGLHNRAGIQSDESHTPRKASNKFHAPQLFGAIKRRANANAGLPEGSHPQFPKQDSRHPDAIHPLSG
jgi:hypothetical protein